MWWIIVYIVGWVVCINALAIWDGDNPRNWNNEERAAAAGCSFLWPIMALVGSLYGVGWLIHYASVWPACVYLQRKENAQ